MNMPHSSKHKPIVSVWVSQLCVCVCECVFRSLYEMMSGRYTWEIFKCAQHFYCFHLPETSEGQSSGRRGGAYVRGVWYGVGWWGYHWHRNGMSNVPSLCWRHFRLPHRVTTHERSWRITVKAPAPKMGYLPRLAKLARNLFIEETSACEMVQWHKKWRAHRIEECTVGILA